MLGRTLDDRYQVLRLLGEGGMGSVYEARHVGTGRRLALKTITTEYARLPALIQRFEIEAKAAGAIESQHIAHVLDVGVDRASGTPYLVMELLVGETLEQHLGRLKALPTELALRIAAQACLGLSKAHAAGIIHRDVKPPNVFLAERDAGEIVVKLLDFGIAKVLLDDAAGKAPGVTRTGHLVGTPLYMSPEQASGDRPVTFATDIWSLGVALYEMLSGRTPHHQIRAAGRLIIEICSTPAPPLRELAPWVDRRVEALVMKAISIDPEARFASADEMLDAIRPRVASFSMHRDMLVREQAFVLSAEEEGSPESIAARPTAPVLQVSSDTSVSGDAATIEVQSTTGAGSLSGGAHARSILPPARKGRAAVVALVALGIAGALGIAIFSGRAHPDAPPTIEATPRVPPSAVIEPLVPTSSVELGPTAPSTERAADAGARPALAPKRPPIVDAGKSAAPGSSGSASPKKYDPLSEM